MIDNSLKSVINDTMISKALIEQSVEKLQGNKRIYIFSDHSDSRKPYSRKLENLGKVRDLNGNIINGYTTLGSIILDENKKDLTLSNITVESNREPTFVSKKELRAYEKGEIEDAQREKEIKKLIEDDTYKNTIITLKKHLKEQSKAFKEANPDISICHVHDRGSDSIEYLEFIKDELEDDAVVRAKKSRNSQQTKLNPKTDKQIKIKLIDSEFANKTEYTIDKLTLKAKQYQHAKCLIEWDTITLNESVYSTVRVTLFRRDGTRLYAEPMLLLSTLSINSWMDAKEIYHIYLHRAKIEGVFKFLKDVLGWEEYQVRDWESIKNIIAICFFIGGYFYEIDSELTKNETIQMICALAKSKGKITRYFFMKGLESLLMVWHVENFKIQNNISEEFYREMQSYAGIIR